MVVSCSNDQTIKVTKFDKAYRKHTSLAIGKHDAPVRMARFTASNTEVVSCSEDTTLRVWDVDKAKNTLTMKGHNYTVNAFKLIEKEPKVISVGRDYSARLWDLRTANC